MKGELGTFTIMGIVIACLIIVLAIVTVSLYSCRDQLMAQAEGTALEKITLQMKTGFDSLSEKIAALSPTKSTFKNLTSNYHILSPRESMENLEDDAIVAILAPWCGHCKRLKESGELKKLSGSAKVIILDDKHPKATDYMKKVGSQGFPTLFFFKSKKLIPYEGPRESSSILQMFNSS